MKITTVDTLIDEFRNGRDIWSRNSVELAVREIERLRKALELIRDEQPKHNGDYWCRRIAEDAIGAKESEEECSSPD